MTETQAQQRSRIIAEAKAKKEAARAARLADKEGVITPDFTPSLIPRRYFP